MNRIDRLSAILIQLQSRRIVKAEEIARRFSISRRTVYRDIRALEDAGVPIGSAPGQGYYIVEGYHLPPVMLTREEAGALLIGGKLVDKFSDPSIQSAFNDALYKIRSVLGMAEKDHLDFLETHVEVLTLADLHKRQEDQRLLREIQSVMGNRVALEIDYQSFYKDELTCRRIEPIGLCFYASHWHLLAFCRLKNDYRDFRVDRIKQLRVTAIKFDFKKHPSLKTLVQKLVMSEKPTPVTVRFRNTIARYLQEQRYYYGYVGQREAENFTEMDFMVSSCTYFARWLLSFLEDVQVVSPEPLKDLMRSYSKRLADHYYSN